MYAWQGVCNFLLTEYMLLTKQFCSQIAQLKLATANTLVLLTMILRARHRINLDIGMYRSEISKHNPGYIVDNNEVTWFHKLPVDTCPSFRNACMVMFLKITLEFTGLPSLPPANPCNSMLAGRT